MRVSLLKNIFFLRSEPKREIELDFVRAIAILLAVGWHFNHVASGSFVSRAILLPGAAIGWAGVDLFFVLSGFLIGRIIFCELRDKGSFDLKRFYIRRFFKLWPLLYMSLFALAVFSGEPPFQYVPQIAFHVQNYFAPSIANHLWSLAVEEHFYLIVAVLLSLFVRFRWSERVVPTSCMLAIVIAPILRAIANDIGMNPVEIQWQTQFRVDSLAAGVLLAWIAVFREQFWNRTFRFRTLFAVIAVLGSAVLFNSDKYSYFGSTIGYSVAYVTSAAFMLSVYRTRLFTSGSWPSRLVVGISMISYAMYIWHVPVAGFLARIAPRLGLQEGQLIYVGLCYSLSFLVAYLATVIIEQPSLVLRDKLFPRKSNGELPAAKALTEEAPLAPATNNL
ncbi:peptidoglycan/LPS O-acetylase OafA/YrhL [Rhizobium azibense]|uniref:Peptidoglycan/LPS O-acetylase OafA/YrhL n=1 Tax=Rhizobium azibense TaxID=1136135 RepID=A0A4R3Q2W9_9HYPH|nr:peptidoglycan/LPS O-acetylase OafA/YrhL [Rhizobium azibense]